MDSLCSSSLVLLLLGLLASVHSLLDKQKPIQFQYNDPFVRSKIFPMAAAAYGDEMNIMDCIRKSFTKGDLIRLVQVNCLDRQKQFCAGFVGVSHSDRAIILSFRGTSSFPQLVQEMSNTMFTSRTNNVIGGKVASYFSDILDQLKTNGLLNETISLIKKYPAYELWITGHSLGGALASLAAAELYSKNAISVNKVKLVTFGQPRTGDSVWASAMDKIFNLYNYRVIHFRDIVPQIPPTHFLHYRHYATEIFYENNMAAANYTDCGEGDLVAATEEMDLESSKGKRCSGKIHIRTISDHRYYFGIRVKKFGIAGCA